MRGPPIANTVSLASSGKGDYTLREYKLKLCQLNIRKVNTAINCDSALTVLLATSLRKLHCCH